jgi:hypothetical protein
VADPSVMEIMQALADQIQSTLCGTADPLIDRLQVDGKLVWNASPPAVDIYPADPFTEQIGMGPGNKALYLTIRARVNTPDHEGAQELLLSMMDPRSATSVEQAILADKTLGSKVSDATVDEGPSEYGAFVDPGGGGALLGCTWRVRVIP